MVNASSTAGAAADPVVELDRVALTYPGGGRVLSDASLALPAGAFRFLTGPSGAGKTSLIRLLLAAERATAGTVRVFGADVATLAPAEIVRLRRRVGPVFQDFLLVDHLSVFENVALPLRVRGREERTYRAEVTELLDWVGLRGRAEALPPTLSGGEKQRAAIARAVVAGPDLILADEPTGNVDPHLARRLLHLFVELNRSGTTVLVATHDAILMNGHDADRLILSGGRIVAERGRASARDPSGPPP